MLFPKDSAFNQPGHHESDAEVAARRHAMALDTLSPNPRRTGTTEVYTESLEQWYETLGSIISVHHLAMVEVPEGVEEVRNEIYSYLKG